MDEDTKINRRDFLKPEAMAYSGRDPAKKGGMIFLGKTGCGKTYFSRACATALIDKAEAPVHYIYASYGKRGAYMWRGAEAGKLAKDFDRIRKITAEGEYVAYFIEEIQSVGQRDESPQHSNEFLNELLAQTGDMDYTMFLMMAATAVDPSSLDPQLLRPGRFGEHVVFKPPISTEDASDIFRVVIERADLIAQANDNKTFLDQGGIDYKPIGEIVTELSPAQICDVVYKELIHKTDHFLEEDEWIPLSTENLIQRAGWYVENKATLSINVDVL